MSRHGVAVAKVHVEGHQVTLNAMNTSNIDVPAQLQDLIGWDAMPVPSVGCCSHRNEPSQRLSTSLNASRIVGWDLGSEEPRRMRRFAPQPSGHGSALGAPVLPAGGGLIASPPEA